MTTKGLMRGGIIAVAVSIILLGFCSPGYLLHVSKGHLSIIWNRRPIPEVIKDESVEKSLRDKLKKIPEIQRFAVEKLHLKKTESYLYYTHIDRDYVVWNVSACEPLEFKAYTWWFPIAGTVPYKGYYKKEYAEEEAEEIRQEGFDVRVRGVSAYSTLGWFDDPVLTTFLRRDEINFASTIIHEMAHQTLYFAGDTRFNESFASFVEDKGIEVYIKHKYGPQAEQLKNYRLRKADSALFLQEMKKTAQDLDKVYKSAKLTNQQKLQKKREIIDDLKKRGTTGKIPFKYLNYSGYFEQELNNTHFQSVLRYRSGQGGFEKFFRKHNGDLKKFLEAMSTLADLSPQQRWARLEE